MESAQVAVAVSTGSESSGLGAGLATGGGSSTKLTKTRTEMRRLWDELLTTVKASPDLTQEQLKAMLAPLVDDEFPDEIPVPTAENVDNAVNVHLPDPNTPCLYTVGQWIERFHDDMQWKLEPIRKIVALTGTNEDTGLPETTYYYRMGSGVMVRHDLVRCPEEGLKRAFGLRPWVWQQWATLKLEEFLRFQDGHQRDFEVIDLQVLPTHMWHSWLSDPRNAEFKAVFDSKPPLVQEKLRDHLFKDFKFMHDAVNDKKNWNVVDDSRFSVYQYTSFLGSGFVLSIFIMFLQLTIPTLMLMFAIRSSSRFSNFPVETETWDFGKIVATDFDRFCNAPGPFDAMFINVVIFFLYAIRVAPSIAQQVYSTMGDEPTIESRLNSLRNNIWLQGDDTVFMQIGFKMDRYMNTLYLVGINALMLVVLFLTESTSDIILNALAIEFVYSFDKAMTKLTFYDPGGRFLLASIVEMQICSTLKLEALRSGRVFAEEFDIPDYQERLGGWHAMDNATVAARDAHNPKFMSVEDKMFSAMAEYAMKNSKSSEALWQFKETPSSFGAVDVLLRRAGLLGGGIFHRYYTMCTWSQWDQVLFASVVPSGGTIRAAPILPSVARNGEPLLNYNPQSSWNPLRRFLNEFKRTLTFQTGWDAVALSFRLGNYHHVPVRIVDAIFEWFVFVVILVYPLVLVLYLAIIFGCQPIL